MLHKVPAVPVGVQTAVHSHSRQHEGTFRPFSRLLRQAGHTVGQFCTPKGDPGTTGGVGEIIVPNLSVTEIVLVDSIA